MKDENKTKKQLVAELQEMRRRAEELGGGRAVGAAEEKERFYRDVLDSILDGISILDKDLNIILTNRVMEKWYAHQMPLKGKKCYKAYHGRSKHCEVCPSLRTLESGKEEFDVVPMTGPEGVKGWLELYTFPLVDFSTGEVTGVIEYVKDITTRKKVEEEKEELIRELQGALREIKTLKVMIPACAWNKPGQEKAIKEHYDNVSKFGKCPECLKALKK